MPVMKFVGEDGKQWRQWVLDTYFADSALTEDDVDEVAVTSDVVPFPRSLNCDCKRCTSPWVEHAVQSKMVIVKAKGRTYSVLLPGAPETFQHKWE